MTESNPPILVVDDEAPIRQALERALRLEGFGVECASGGREALEAVARRAPAAIILDVTMPDLNGRVVCARLRADGVKTPILILSARDEVDDRIAGLQAGADDYLAKPFAFVELLARCRALLRRPVLGTGTVLRCGDLQLDTRARVAMRAGGEIPLTPREVDVLEYLLRAQGQIVTREMLERDVWKQTHRFTSLDNVIDVQLMRLRKKVDGDGTEKLIHTLRGLGYRLGKEPA